MPLNRGSGMRRTLGLLAVVMVVAAGCGWARPRYDAGNTGANPTETSITAATVGSLSEQFRAAASATNAVPKYVVSRGHLYLGGAPARVVDAAGVSGCGGSPRTCAPQWTVTANDAPDVMGSTLYWGGNATDADGVKGCTGTPRQCDVLWIDTGTGIPTGPVDAGTLHFTLGGYSIHNTESVYLYGHRSPEPSGCGFNCSSVWSTFLGTGAPGGIVGGPALGGSTVFVSYSPVGAPIGSLYAFDGTDATGPQRWRAALPGVGSSFVAVAEGVVVTVVRTTTGSELVAYDAAGVTNCSGSPVVCLPLWTSAVWTGVGAPTAPAIANGTVFFGFGSQMAAYDIHGSTRCSGMPTVCSPMWTAGTGDGVTAPAVAGGLVFTSDRNGRVAAYDAGGVANCSPSIRVCGPLWTTDVGVETGPVEVTGGRLYVGAADGTVRVFGLPV